MGSQGRGLCPSAALEEPTVDLDGQLPFVRPLPHVAVLRDGLPQLFQDDSGAEEEEEAELRGEHTLMEKFGEGGPGAPVLGEAWPSRRLPVALSVRKEPAGPREVELLVQLAQPDWGWMGPSSQTGALLATPHRPG